MAPALAWGGFCALLACGCARAAEEPAAGDAPAAAAEVAAIAEAAWSHQLDRSVYLRVKHGLPIEEIPDLTPARAEADAAVAAELIERVDGLALDQLDYEDALTAELVRWQARQVHRLGLEKLLELRRRARELLGERFDIRELHQVLLGSGAMPLSLLERHVEHYLERTGAASYDG